MTEIIEELHTKLNTPPPVSALSTRTQSGRELTYLEGHYVIAKANELFGASNWSRTFVGDGLREVSRWEGTPPKKDYKRYDVSYICSYRIIVLAGGKEMISEDVGYGVGQSYNGFGDAIESAVKEAVTDALKRCLRSLGNAFGNCLYDKQWLSGEGHKGEQQDETPPTTPPPKTKTPPAKPATHDDDSDLTPIRVSLAALCSKAKVPLLDEADMRAAAVFYRDLMMAKDPLGTTPKKVAAALDSKKTQQQALDTITKYYDSCNHKEGDAA